MSVRCSQHTTCTDKSCEHIKEHKTSSRCPERGCPNSMNAMCKEV